MSDPAILFVKPGAISSDDKAALKEAGVIVIEIDDPQSVKFTRAYGEIEGPTLLKMALKVIHEGKSDAAKINLASLICDGVLRR